MMTDKKALCFLLAFCLIIQGVLFGNVTEVQAAAEPTEGYQYFDVDLFDYKVDNRNNIEAEGTINYLLKNAKPASVLRFLYDTDNSVSVNGWRNGDDPSKGTALPEMVKDELTADGKIQFESDYDPETIGLLDNDIVIEGVKDVYEDVKLPFLYDEETGYYEFNSNDTNAYFDSVAAAGEYLMAEPYESAGCLGGSSTGFWPFGTGNYHFGMTFTTDFFMTDNGLDANGNAIKFEFAGDDDVWVFIDGKLILDIGGIHGAIGGTIDFAGGTAITEGVDDDIEPTEQSGELWEMLGTTEEVWRRSTTPHTLQVFYLERGAGESNCKIKFNLPKKDYVEVSKVMGNEIDDTSKLDVLNQLNFNFYIYYQPENGERTSYANAKYRLYNVDEVYLGTRQTTADGHFTLKFGEIARFYLNAAVEKGDTFYVEEDNSIALDTNATGGGRVWTTMENGKIVDGAWNDGQYGNGAKLTMPQDASSAVEVVKVYTFQCENTVASPAAYDDVVVLDYGKPVEIDVLKNDAIFNEDTDLDGIMRHGETLAEADLDILTLQFDCADHDGRIAGRAIFEDNKQTIRYTPNDYIDCVKKFDYQVSSMSNNTVATATVTIVPANNVYYEDNYATVFNEDGTIAKTAIQFSKDFHIGNIPDDSVQKDENKVYGYDDSYDGQYGHSGGSATEMAVGDTAEFTFKGTGVDVYTSTNKESPSVFATLYNVTQDADGNEQEVFCSMLYVDNKYDQKSGEEMLYQIPTISFSKLEYGKYTVRLFVATDTGKYFLDGIRIYNPINNKDTNVKYAYQLADEEDTVVEEVRDYLLRSDDWQSGKTDVTGVAYIDNTWKTDDEGNNTETGIPADTNVIDDYLKDGPKNEVYLSKNNGIAFAIPNYDEGQKVYIGMKSPTGVEVPVEVTDGTTTKIITINSTVDRYYEIIPATYQEQDSDGEVAKYGRIMIRNATELGENEQVSDDSLLSITKIRISNRNETDEAQVFIVNDSTMNYVQAFSAMSLRKAKLPAEPEEEIKTENTNQPDANYVEKENHVANIVAGFEEIYNRSKEEE